ncbi:3-oxoacyl-[acyl-carrier-protein] synthase II [Tepidamorphus gemmatus]|jgi:3-oxoacyl-[acyl-carrier-protein] synthase II|uniref:3-oxoacyl-[acyl-carrier-protein] synthase II n=1 Tax=Tepidamorphus gemmatus TaxID=747076 RepID=A0A4R3MMR6_9HYPH|nr:beta-ketoacyl-ACP synthase [Tepidamorphus gemmatus]TCT13286.1 3-oxoacyl-[acyl-carrier-protein] synthase II [Tepidamorphus gemmatus]
MSGNGRYLDSKGRPVVVVTGMGLVTSLGRGRDDNWKALTAGMSGIHRISRFPVDGLRTTIGGTIDFVSVEPFCAPALSERLAEMAMEEAIEQAAIGSAGDFPGPLFLAVAPVEMEWPQREELARSVPHDGPYDYHVLLEAAHRGRPDLHRRFLFGGVAETLADRFGTKGSPISLSTACASGATAIQLAVEAIRRGEADAAVSVGTDGSIQAEALIRFSLLSALSTQNDPPEAAAKPFSKNRDGFVMAEGAGALVLESLAHARARGARILGVVEGAGECADSFHRTRSNPDGHTIVGCITAALDDAGVTPADIDYINAHGTGTPENDKMECLGVQTVFADRAKDVLISSNKSMIGHTLSAAGAVEAVFTLMTIAEGRVPPTINYTIPDPAIPLDVVPNVARDARVRRAMSNSFGFGGQNVCLVFAGEPA